MPEDVMLREAIDAVRQGQRTRARDLLTRLLRADQSNPVYWVWMSSVVDTTKEQVYCLQTALRLDPSNGAARKGLIMTGANPPDEGVLPQPPMRRKWEIKAMEEPPTGVRALLSNRVARLAFFVLAGVVLIGLVMGGIFGISRKPAAAVAVRPTKTPGPPPTFTLTPTRLGGEPTLGVTPSPTYQGPQPLWMLLEATYTPTPLYINTPHPISEAFRAGQRALDRGDVTTALEFFTQASQVDLDAPDIWYYIGEVHRTTGDYTEALDAYQQSMAIDAGFAPAYLGRARVRLATSPGADIGQDLQAAIERDPNLGEAYFELTAYHLSQQDVEAAGQALVLAESLLPESPLVSMYRARISHLDGDLESAQELASLANKQDITLLPVYLTLGQVSLALGDYPQAVAALKTYVDYMPDDPIGWLGLAQAYTGISQPEQAYLLTGLELDNQEFETALQAFDRAIELNEEIADLHFYRGLLYLGQGEGQKAVNDMVSARKIDSRSFLINLGLGRALLLAGRPRDAHAQIGGAEALVESDEQLAALYYWRAMAAEEIPLKNSAVKDWQALLDLPQESRPAGWDLIAQEHLWLLLGTPTPTPTQELTPTRTVTPTITKTPTRTPTLTKTPLP